MSFILFSFSQIFQFKSCRMKVLQIMIIYHINMCELNYLLDYLLCMVYIMFINLLFRYMLDQRISCASFIERKLLINFICCWSVATHGYFASLTIVSKGVFDSPVGLSQHIQAESSYANLIQVCFICSVW
jgi:hypothetical protein